MGLDWIFGAARDIAGLGDSFVPSFIVTSDEKRSRVIRARAATQFPLTTVIRFLADTNQNYTTEMQKNTRARLRESCA